MAQSSPDNIIKRTETMRDIPKLHNFLHKINCPSSFYPSTIEFDLFKSHKDSIILFLHSYPYASSSNFLTLIFPRQPNPSDKAFFSKYFIILFLHSPLNANYLPLIFLTLRRLYLSHLYSTDDIVFFIKLNLLKRSKTYDNHIKATMLFMHDIIRESKEVRIKEDIIKGVIGFLEGVFEEKIQTKMEMINENIHDLFTFEEEYNAIGTDIRRSIDGFIVKMVMHQYTSAFHAEVIQSITKHIGDKGRIDIQVNRYMEIIRRVIGREEDDCQCDSYAFDNGFYFNDNHLNEIRTEYDCISNDAYIIVFSFKLSKEFKGNCTLVSISDKDIKKDTQFYIRVSFAIVDMELVINSQNNESKRRTNVRFVNEKSYTILIAQSKSINQKEGEMIVYVNGIQCTQSTIIFSPEKNSIINLGKNANDTQCDFIGFFGTFMFFSKITKALIDELLSYGSDYERRFFGDLISDNTTMMTEDKYEMLKVIISSSWKTKYHKSKSVFYQNYLDVPNMRMIDRSVSVSYAYPYKRHSTISEFIALDGIKYLQLYCEYYLQFVQSNHDKLASNDDKCPLKQILKAIEELMQVITVLFNKSNSKSISSISLNKINIDNSWINASNKDYEAHDIMFFFGTLTDLIKQLIPFTTLHDFDLILPSLLLIIDTLPFFPLYNTLRQKLFYFLLDNSLHVSPIQKQSLMTKLLQFIKDSPEILSPLSLLDRLIEYDYKGSDYDVLLEELYRSYYKSSGSKPVDHFLLLMVSKVRKPSKSMINLPMRVVRLLMDPITSMQNNDDLLLSFLTDAIGLVSNYSIETDEEKNMIDNQKAILLQLFRYLSFENNKISNFFGGLSDIKKKEINYKSFKSLIAINYKVSNFPLLMQMIIDDDDNDGKGDLFMMKFYDAKEYYELNERLLKKKLMFLCKIFKENVPLNYKEKCYQALFNLFFYLMPRFSIEEVEKDKKENSDTDSSSTSFLPKEQEKKRSFIESTDTSSCIINKSLSLPNKANKSELYRIFHSKQIIPSIYIDYISLQNTDDLNQLSHIIILHHSSPFFFQLLFSMFINAKFDKDPKLTIFHDLLKSLFTKVKPKYSKEQIFDDAKGINRINFLVLLYKMSTMRKHWKIKHLDQLEYIYIEFIPLLINNAVLYSNVEVVFPFSNAATLDLSKNSYQTQCHKFLFEIVIEILINIINNSDSSSGKAAHFGLLKMVMFKGIDLKQQHSVLYEFSMRLLVQKMKKVPNLKDYDKIEYYENLFNHSSYNRLGCHQMIPHIHYLIKFIILSGNTMMGSAGGSGNMLIKGGSNGSIQYEEASLGQLETFYKDVIGVLLKELNEMYKENKRLKMVNSEDSHHVIAQPIYDLIRKEICNSKGKADLKTLTMLINEELKQKERITEENNYRLSKFEKDGKIKREKNQAVPSNDNNRRFKTMIDTQTKKSMNMSMFQNSNQPQQMVIIDNYDRVSMYRISDNDLVHFPMMNDKKVFMYISFGYHFRKVTYYNRKFCQLKERHKAQFVGLFNNDYFIEDLDHPTRLMNYYTKDYKRCFLKPDLRFFTKPYLHVSHAKLTEGIHSEDAEDMTYLVPFFANKTMIAAEKLLSNSTNSDNDSNVFNCELITIEGAIYGKINLLHNYMVFKHNEENEDIRFQCDSNNDNPLTMEDKPQTPRSKIPFLMTSIESDVLRNTPKAIIINYANISIIITRRFIYSLQAIELFLKNGRSYLFNMISPEKKEAFLKTINLLHPHPHPNHHIKIINNFLEEFRQRDYSDQWQQGRLSTFDYLLHINFFSSRSFNDVNQYPIFPWLNMTNNKHLAQRDFSFPMAAQKEDKRLNLIRQSKDKLDRFPNQLNSHYSTGAFTLYYLVRIDPFTTNMIKLQTGHLDNPNRMFCSFNEIFQIFEAASDNRELIPELFYFYELFLNLNYATLGIRSSKEMIHHFKFDHSASVSNPIDYVIKQRKYLESPMIKKEIHKWIDNVFGHLQLDMSKGSCNIFMKYSYEEKLNILRKVKKKREENKPEKVIWNDLRTKVSCIQNFGQTPMRLFNERHPHYQDINTLLAEISGSSVITLNSMGNNGVTIGNGGSLNLSVGGGNEMNLSLNHNEKWIHFNVYENDEGDGDGEENVVMCFIKKNKGKTSHLLKKKTFHYYESHGNSNSNSNKKERNVQVNLKKLSLGYHKIKHSKKDMVYSMNNVYELFHVDNRTYAAFSNYIDNTIKFYDIETLLPVSKVTNEAFATVIKAVDKDQFITGHDNGKVIHWRLASNDHCITNSNGNSTFSLKQIKSVINQRTEVLSLSYNSNRNIIMITDAEGSLYIRALESFELLSIITPSHKPMSSLRITSINISPYDILCLTAVDTSSSSSNAKSIIFAYSFNGVCFSKSDAYLSNIQFLSNSNLLCYGIVNSRRRFIMINPAKLSEITYELKHVIPEDVLQFYYLKDKGSIIYLDSHGTIHQDQLCKEDLYHLTNDVDDGGSNSK